MDFLFFAKVYRKVFVSLFLCKMFLATKRKSTQIRSNIKNIYEITEQARI